MSNLKKIPIPPRFNTQLVSSKFKTEFSIEHLFRHCLRNFSTFDIGTPYYINIIYPLSKNGKFFQIHAVHVKEYVTIYIFSYLSPVKKTFQRRNS